MEPTIQTQTDMPQPEPQTPAPAPQAPTDTPSEPVSTPVETPSQPSEPAQQVQTVETPEQTATATPATAEPEEDYPSYQPVAPVPPIDFSQLPVDENNLIDPNALASQINSRIAMAEQNAAARAQQIYAEQENEKRQWDKAYEKYPELKSNKELRDMVHNARLGKVTELLSQVKDPSQVAQLKMPTPAQMADTLFKHITSAKSEGFTQATQNTEVQRSAVLESSGPAKDTSGDAIAQAKANLNNPNQEVRSKARAEVLKNFLGWN